MILLSLKNILILNNHFFNFGIINKNKAKESKFKVQHDPWQYLFGSVLNSILKRGLSFASLPVKGNFEHFIERLYS